MIDESQQAAIAKEQAVKDVERKLAEEQERAKAAPGAGKNVAGL
jgi:hypothetical protein